MSRLNFASRSLLALEELAARDTLLTRLSPLAKLLSVLIYLGVTLSFPQTALSGLLGMALYPCLLYPLGDLPFRRAIADFRFLLPVPLFLGLVPALFGQFSALLLAVLVLKSLLAFLAVFLLAASTGMYELTAALARLHAPRLFTTVLLLSYRYLFVLLREGDQLADAYSLRAPGKKAVSPRNFASMIGQLLLRSIDRAQLIYESMKLRGFSGVMTGQPNAKRSGITSALFLLFSMAYCLLFRLFPVFERFGSLLF